jgi:threonine/homoserine/homoserine lactone efflux protein
MFLSFLFAFTVSFLGSVQLGFVNVQVILTAINHGFYKGSIVALGGSIPELFYCFLAFAIQEKIENSPFISTTIPIVSIPLLAGWGFYLYFKPPAKIHKPENRFRKYGLFSSGMFLGFLNPILLAFWIFYIQAAKTWNLNLHLKLNKLAFILGASFGAFCILLIFAFLGHFFRNHIIKFLGDNIRKIAGILLILMAFIQAIKLIYS